MMFLIFILEAADAYFPNAEPYNYGDWSFG